MHEVAEWQSQSPPHLNSARQHVAEAEGLDLATRTDTVSPQQRCRDRVDRGAGGYLGVCGSVLCDDACGVVPSFPIDRDRICNCNRIAMCITLRVNPSDGKRFVARR